MGSSLGGPLALPARCGSGTARKREPPPAARRRGLGLLCPASCPLRRATAYDDYDDAVGE